MQQYESTFIVDAHLSDDAVEKTIEKFKKVIEDGGATVHNIDRWGKRRLAYEIGRKQYGYYVYVRFEGEGTFIQELERVYKLDDAILRYLTVVVPVVALKQEKREADKRAAEAKKTEPDKKTPESPPADDMGAEGKKEEGAEEAEKPEASEPGTPDQDRADEPNDTDTEKEE